MIPFRDAYRGRGAFASASRPPLTTRFVPFARSVTDYSVDPLRTDAVAARPADAVLGWSAADDRYVDGAVHPDVGVTPGVVVYRIQDRLFFANAHFFKRRLWAAVDGAPRPVRHVVLDASSISDIDASAGAALREVLDGLGDRNIELHVARASTELQHTMADVGLIDAIGADHFHSTIETAVEICGQLPATGDR